jgi:hypothetical protein
MGLWYTQHLRTEEGRSAISMVLAVG